MCLDRTSSAMPLYHQLKETLSNRIEKGDWSVGDRIPLEAVLCKEYDVSRITVRQALTELRQQGLIVRQQGKGTFVSTPKIEQDLMGFYSFSDEFRRRGMQPRSETLEFAVLEKQNDFCRFLCLPETSKVYHFKRLRYANNTLMAIESTYLPFDYFVGLTADVLQKRALYDVMRSDYGIHPNLAEESFGAVLLQEEEAQLFDLLVGDPGLDIVRKAYSGSDCIEYTYSVIRGDKFRFHVDLRHNIGSN